MKTITVLKRAEIKKASVAYNVNPGDIICMVKGSTGNVYMTTLRRNKQHSCTCPGHTHGYVCYHIRELRKLENARYDAEKAYAMSTDLHAKLAPIATPEQIATTEESVTLKVKPAQELAPVACKPKVRKSGNKLVKLDHRSAQTLAFFSNLPSRQKEPAA